MSDEYKLLAAGAEQIIPQEEFLKETGYRKKAEN